MEPELLLILMALGPWIGIGVALLDARNGRHAVTTRQLWRAATRGSVLCALPLSLVLVAIPDGLPFWLAPATLAAALAYGVSAGGIACGLLVWSRDRPRRTA
jgi:hypothetical protein